MLRVNQLADETCDRMATSDSDINEERIEMIDKRTVLQDVDSSRKRSNSNEVKSISCHHAEYMGVPVDHGWAWVVVLGAFGMTVMNNGILKSFGVLLVEMSRTFDVSTRAITSVQSITGFFFLALGPFSSVLCMKYSHRSVVIAGGLLSSIGLMASAFSPSVEWLYVTYGLIVGIGFGLTFTPTIVFMTYHFKKHKSLANGLTVSGSGFGTFAFPLLMRYLIDSYTLQGCMMIISGLALNMCTFACLFRPFKWYKKKNLNKHNCDSVPEKSHLLQSIPTDGMDDGNNKKQNEELSEQNCCDLENEECVKSVPHLAISLNDIVAISSHSIMDLKTDINPPTVKGCCQQNCTYLEWHFLLNPLFEIYNVSLFLVTMSYHAVFNILPPFVDELGFSDTEGAMLISIFGISDLFGRILFGWIADFQFVQRKYLFLLNILLNGIGMIVYPQLKTMVRLRILSGFHGFFSGGFNGILIAVLTDALGIQHVSSVFGFVAFFAAIAMLFQPIISGGLRDATGTWTYSFYSMGTCALVSSLVLLLLEPVALRKFQQTHRKLIKEDAI